ncbi:MAG TPA: hypothetical protein PKV84_05650 [Candidatus Omnitrophota bacterium]|nr:hypothetical protein [Candidatus Omnitrophota bacterium]
MGSKLVIVFAFLLSVAAAGGSYYLYQGWVEERTVRGSVEAKYDQVKEKMITIQSEKEQLKAKSEEYRSKAEAMQSQLERLQSEQSRIDSEKATLEKQLKTHQGMIADLQKQVADLARKAKEAQAACGVTPQDLQTDILSAPKPFGDSTPASGTPTTQLTFKPVSPSGATVSVAYKPSTASSVIPSTSSDTGAPPAAKTAVEVPAGSESVKEIPQTGSTSSVSGAAVSAKVLTVNRKFNFVVINQGLQDGLKMGDKLKVLKQGQESATIQVEKLYDKFSAATILEEDPKQQVVEGDEIRGA